MANSIISQTPSILPKRSKSLKDYKPILTTADSIVNFIIIVETVYKNDFVEKANPLCPAKIFL